MKDYKTLIRIKLREANAINDLSDTYRASSGGTASNEKTKKLLVFAEPILYEFADQIEKKLKTATKKNHYGIIDCTARYALYIPNWLGMPKKGSSTLDVTIGKIYVSRHYDVPDKTIPLVINHTEYGKKTNISEIDEAWFISVLVREYNHMSKNRYNYGW